MKRKSLQLIPAPVGSWHAAPAGQPCEPARLGSPSGRPRAPAQHRAAPCRPCAPAAQRGAGRLQRFARAPEPHPSWIRPSRQRRVGGLLCWGMRRAEAGMRD